MLDTLEDSQTETQNNNNDVDNRPNNMNAEPIYNFEIPNFEFEEKDETTHEPAITEDANDPSEETRVEDISVIQNPLSDPMATAIQTELNMIKTISEDEDLVFVSL